MVLYGLLFVCVVCCVCVCGVQYVCGFLLVPSVKWSVVLRVLCVVMCLCVLFMVYRVVLYGLFVIVSLCMFGCLMLM